MKEKEETAGAPAVPALRSLRVSSFFRVVSGRRRKLNDREGALKSEAHRGGS